MKTIKQKIQLKQMLKSTYPFRNMILGLIMLVFILQPLQAQSQNNDENTQNNVEKLIQRADSLNSQRQFDKAIPLYLQAIKQKPADPRLYEPLAYSYIKLGLFDEGRKWLLERQKYSKNPAIDQCLLADLAARRGDFQTAMIHTDSLIRLSGENPSWSLLACAAEVESIMGEYKQAKDRIEAGVAELRRKGKPLHGLFFLAFFKLQEGDTAYAKELLAEHEALAKKKLSEGKGVAVSHLDLAAIEALRGRAEAAVHHLREGLNKGGWGQYWGGYYYIMNDPIFKSLHGHPEFEQLMEEMKEDIDRMRENVVKEQGLNTAGSKPGVVEVIAREYEFEMPAEIPYGWTTFRVKNEGQNNHFFEILRMPKDVTVEEMNKAVEQFKETNEPPTWWSEAISMGGTGFISPEHLAQRSIYLEPGRYIARGSVQHLLRGMSEDFIVTEEPSGAVEPEADVLFTIKNEQFVLQGELSAGEQTILIAPSVLLEGHDIHFGRIKNNIAPGKLADRLKNVQEKTSAFDFFLGGAQDINDIHENGPGTFTVNLKPGNYAWLCQEHSEQQTTVHKVFTVH